MRNISAWAIKNPIPPIVLFVALTIAGLSAYFQLPVNQIPNVEFGEISVTVTQAGASPSELETQVTQQVEAALTSVTGIDKIVSTIRQGESETADDVIQFAISSTSSVWAVSCLPCNISLTKLNMDLSIDNAIHWSVCSLTLN